MSVSNRTPYRILFVCLGNICRSPAAEAIMAECVEKSPTLRGRIEVDSAGTGGYHIGSLPDRRMRVHARERGLELTHHCRQVNEADFEHFDLIVAMDDSNYRDLCEMAPTTEAMNRIVRMSDYLPRGYRYDHIPDPYYEGSEGFELVLDLLQDGMENLVRQLESKI